MKRNWNVIRKQLTMVEEGNDLFSELPPEPQWKNQGGAEYEQQLKACRVIEDRIFGHFELLVNAGYIDGLRLVRPTDGLFSYQRCGSAIRGH